MKLDFDPEKNAWNIRERGLAFSAVEGFDFETALTIQDERHEYGETRFITLGLIGGRLHVVVYVRIDGGIRVISLRKANARERERYVEKA